MWLVGWTERNTTQRLAESGSAQGAELLVRRAGGSCVAQRVGDSNQPVGIGACVAVAAHRGGNSPDGHGAVVVHAAGKIAQTVCCRRPWESCDSVNVGRKPSHRIRRAKIEAILQRVGKFPAL